MLELRGLSKKYGDLEALKPCNLQFDQGVYGLLGPNGAGKSTLMNIICQNLKASTGTIFFEGRDTGKNSKYFRSKLGYMPQQQGLYPNFTAYRFLSYIAALKGMSIYKARREVKEVLEIVKLSDRAKDKLASFSGGMKQRILIAQAILNKPQILILDEPTAGLDPKERIRIRNLIAEIAGDRIILLASHVVSDIEQIARKIIFLKEGKVIQNARPQDLLDQLPATVFELIINPQDYARIKELFEISSVQYYQDKIKLRIIVRKNEQSKEIQGAPKVYPSLEEVYLYHFSNRSE